MLDIVTTAGLRAASADIEYGVWVISIKYEKQKKKQFYVQNIK